MLLRRGNDEAKCGYCGFIASSVHELCSRHSCSRTLRQQNMLQQHPRVSRPSVIKSAKLQALRAYRSSETTQTKSRESLWQEVNSSTRDPSSTYYGYRPPILTSHYSEMQPLVSSATAISLPKMWEEFDEPELPVPVAELSKTSRENYLLKPANNNSRRRYTVANENPAFTTPSTSTFYHDEGSSAVQVFPGAELPATESSSESMQEHVILVSPSNKEIKVVLFDDVLINLKERLKRLPYITKLKLEYDFLKKVQDAVSEAELDRINTMQSHSLL